MASPTARPAVNSLTLTDEDLRASVGPNADAYVTYLKKFRERRHLLHQFIWIAVLLPLVWLAYRKFYAGIVIFVGIVGAFVIAQEYLPSPVRFDRNVGIALAVTVAGTGKTFVITRAVKHAARADATGLLGASRRDFLAERGGTSWISAVLAGIFTVGVAGWVFYSFQGAAP